MKNSNEIKKLFYFLIPFSLLVILLINIYININIDKKYQEDMEYNKKILNIANYIVKSKKNYKKELNKVLENLKDYCSINEEENYFKIECNDLNYMKAKYINMTLNDTKYLIIKEINIKKSLSINNIKDNNINIKLEIYKGYDFE